MIGPAPVSAPEAPTADCARCPRLAAFRSQQRKAHGDWFNAPVPAFGPRPARLVIVGLAPGLKGANRTGRPFTGDFAGDLLYQTLIRHGLARGAYAARVDDGLELVDTVIVNAVRCVPPANKPTGAEIKACNGFLAGELAANEPRAILALGRIAHDAVLRAFGLKLKPFAFAHAARHRLAGDAELFDSYHCSRYNTNTGRLTPAMFDHVVKTIAERLEIA